MTGPKEQTGDALASLASKELFLQQLKTFLDQEPSQEWCVAAVDVEHFKLYNEWYGLEQGDCLLETLAGWLCDYHARTHCPVGYFGNDDFFLCLRDEDAEIYEVYRQLQACVDRNEDSVSFFIAMGICPVDGRDSTDCYTLCNYAQIAAGNHKQSGGSLERFSPAMLDSLKQRQQLLTELERALRNEEFCFYLQPKCNSMTHAIVGMEALVRWNHPTRGIVSPGGFVPLMEETGLVTQLDLYLWEAVCKMLHRWKQEGRNLVPISVNVSIADIASLDVAQVFADLVEKYALEPRLLLVEITESMLAQNMRLVENTILALHHKGFSVLMDDFGSGYSSLNMLKSTSVDGIKLDMKFIDMNEAEKGKGKQIVESVIEMARRLNLPIVAEGVETQEQVFMLQSMDCLYTQGYYFYRPMPVEAAEKLLDHPSIESYWDIHRDLMRRNHKIFTGGLVSEKSAIALQALQIVSDCMMEVSRLNLLTGEYRIVKRDARLPNCASSNVREFSAACRWLEQNILFPEEVAAFRKEAQLDRLREQLFADPHPLRCRFRSRLPGTAPVLTAEVLPCAGCGPTEPWAVALLREESGRNVELQG